MTRYLCTAICFLLARPGSLGAAEYYVAPAGNSTNSGTLAAPWSLQFALTNRAGVSGPATVWFRGGTYSNLYTATLSGSASNSPIVLRNHNRERAVVDGMFNLSACSNLWLWGLEFIDSNKTNRSDPFNTIAGSTGLGTKVINCLIHDCCIGISPPGVMEVYGNIMWNCGKSSKEHPIYFQNVGTEPKVIQNNLIGYSGGFGIHCYSSAGQLRSLHIFDNAVWGQSKAAVLVGGGQPVVDCRIENNDLFCRYDRAIQIGFGGNDGDATIRSNRLYGVTPFRLENNFTNLWVSDNLMASPQKFVRSSLNTLTISSGHHSWDSNAYHSESPWPDWTNTFATFSATNLIGFWQWKTETGFDTNSVFTQTPMPPRVVIRTNRYETKRAHIIVWNGARADIAAADVSSVLSPGDTYEVRSALDYFSDPVISGIYDGTTVNLPLTNLTLAKPLYWTPPPPIPSPLPEFAAFVLLGKSNIGIPPRPPSNLRRGFAP